MLNLIDLTQHLEQPHEASIIIIPILQMRAWRHRVQVAGPGYTAVTWKI